jgi:glycosyltransferase involved in cell wall biosynthesis
MGSTDIVYVIGSLELGGAERHLTQIVPRLKKLGWTPVIYCLTHRGVQAEQLAQHGIEVVGPPFERGGTRALRSFRLLVSSMKLFGLLLRRRPAIAHFFLPIGYVIGGPLAILARVRIRLMSRRSLNLYQNNHPFIARFERVLHAHMHALLGNSLAVVRELQTETRHPEHVHLIYNGVDCDEVHQVPVSDAQPARTSSNQLVLIIVANLIHYKGHCDLLRGLAMVNADLPPDWTLLCVGRDDGLGAELKHLTKELQIDQHVQFLGSRNDVTALLRSADVGILCSHEEGFSNAVLEGMAAGLPMVVTAVGGNAEAAIHEKTGLVVPAHNPAALGAAILAISSRPDLRKQMGMAGRDRVRSEFSFARCTESYDRLYRGLVQSETQK